MAESNLLVYLSQASAQLALPSTRESSIRPFQQLSFEIKRYHGTRLFLRIYISPDTHYRFCFDRQLDKIALAYAVQPLATLDANTSQQILQVISSIIALIEDQIKSRSYTEAEIDKMLDIKHILCVSCELPKS